MFEPTRTVERRISTNIVLGIDIGTTSIGAAALDPDSEAVVHSDSATNTATVPDLAAGFHEQDAGAILRTARELLARVAAATVRKLPRGRVRGVAVCGQMHGVVLVDSSNRPMSHLITWRDQRAARPFRDLETANDRDAANRRGCRLQPGYGLATLHALISGDRRF